jgi:NADH-quinone oxidoreductase subunit E
MLRDTHGAEIDSLLARYAQKRSAVLPLLFIAQDNYGYLTEEAIYEVATILDLPATDVFEVVGFYTLLYNRPVGAWVLQVCDDVPCCFCGAEELIAALREALGVRENQRTPDGMFVLERVKCLAACDQAPVLQANLDYHYKVTPDKVDALLRQLRAWAEQGTRGVSGRLAEDYQIVDGAVRLIARPVQQVPEQAGTAEAPSTPEPEKAEAAEQDSTPAEEAAKAEATEETKEEAPTVPAPDRSPAGVEPRPERQDEGTVPANISSGKSEATD